MKLTYYYSAEGKGMYRTGSSSFAYIPLSTVNPKEAPGLIDGLANKIDNAKRDGKLPPGLAEQYDLQLEVLRNGELPDVEVTVFPGYLVAPSELQTRLVKYKLDQCPQLPRNLESRT